MKYLKLFKGVLKRTYAGRMIVIFVIFFLVEALLFWLVEPGITNYWDALWYSYSVFSTAGFGDMVAMTFWGRILSVLMTVATLLVVALVTGVIVAVYTDIVSMKYKASKAEVLDKLEHLEDLSKEELKDLSERIKKIP